MPGSLNGKVAFITGGASGIGEAAALRLAGEGAAVAIADRSIEDGQRVVDMINRAAGRARFARCDVSRGDEVRAAIDGSIAEFGRLDIVLANAGINGMWAPIDSLLESDWDQTLDVNLKGTFLTLHHAVPHLKRAGGGSIIITSSINGTRTFSNPGSTAYSASKAGQVALMKMAALELGRFNIRVNAICPGMVMTNIFDSTRARDLEKIAINVEYPDGNPALNHGKGTVADVADVCLFLASDLSRHVSGVELFIDGGSSLL